MDKFTNKRTNKRLHHPINQTVLQASLLVLMLVMMFLAPTPFAVVRHRSAFEREEAEPGVPSSWLNGPLNGLLNGSTFSRRSWPTLATGRVLSLGSRASRPTSPSAPARSSAADAPQGRSVALLLQHLVLLVVSNTIFIKF